MTGRQILGVLGYAVASAAAGALVAAVSRAGEGPDSRRSSRHDPPPHPPGVVVP